MDSISDHPRIEICEQDLIDQMAPLGREFFSRVLQLDWDDCLVTDESALSDFSFSGVPEGVIPSEATLREAYAAWDAWILNNVRQHFGIELPRTNLRLLTVFDLIEKHRKQVTH